MRKFQYILIMFFIAMSFLFVTNVQAENLHAGEPILINFQLKIADLKNRFDTVDPAIWVGFESAKVDIADEFIDLRVEVDTRMEQLTSLILQMMHKGEGDLKYLGEGSEYWRKQVDEAVAGLMDDDDSDSGDDDGKSRREKRKEKRKKKKSDDIIWETEYFGMLAEVVDEFYSSETFINLIADYTEGTITLTQLNNMSSASLNLMIEIRAARL